MSYHFLLDLAIILISTKMFGILTKKVKMPQVVGALLAGVILGPAGFRILQETDFIKQLAEVGVIILMFIAGLETSIEDLKKSGIASLVIALLGIFVPLLAGFAVAGFFNNNGSFFAVDYQKVLENVFMGVILTATSVSITVETLRELGKLNSPVGTAILGAAIIDDVLGIIALTIISGASSPNVNIMMVLTKILMFFVMSAAVGIPFYYVFRKYSYRQKERRRYVIIALTFCLLLSYSAEHFFGVADITGAYIAGLILSNSEHVKYLNRRLEITSYSLLAPVFFASIGISASFDKMSTQLIIFTILLLIVAIVSKMAGCGIGARITGFNKKDSMVIGMGMVSRGEVALIVASKGAEVGLMSAIYFGPIIVMVIATTIITPIFLKLAIGKNIKNKPLYRKHISAKN